MRTLLVLAALFSPFSQGLELRELSINYKSFHKSGRIPEMPGFTPKEGITLSMNINLVGPFYWDNRIITITDPGQYRHIAWNFSYGLRLFTNFYIEYEHMSQHLIDADRNRYPDGRFPVRDSFGFRWFIVGAPEGLPSLIAYP